MLEDAKKVKDLQVACLFTKVIELTANEQDVFYQQLVSTTYAMLSSVKNHLQGDIVVLEENIGSKYDITDDDDAFADYGAVFLANGEGIQKRLAGVSVRAVSGVDNGGFAVPGDDCRNAAVLMAHDDVVHLHAHERINRIVHAFALHHG